MGIGRLPQARIGQCGAQLDLGVATGRKNDTHRLAPDGFAVGIAELGTDFAVGRGLPIVADGNLKADLGGLFGDADRVGVGTLGLEKAVKREIEMQRIGDDEPDIAVNAAVGGVPVRVVPGDLVGLQFLEGCGDFLHQLL